MNEPITIDDLMALEINANWVEYQGIVKRPSDTEGSVTFIFKASSDIPRQTLTGRFSQAELMRFSDERLKAAGWHRVTRTGNGDAWYEHWRKG